MSLGVAGRREHMKCTPALRPAIPARPWSATSGTRLRPLILHHRQRLELAVLQERIDRAGGEAAEIDPRGDEVGRRLAAALVDDVGDLRARALRDLLDREVLQQAVAGGAEVEAARLVLAQLDQLLMSLAATDGAATSRVGVMPMPPIGMRSLIGS